MYNNCNEKGSSVRLRAHIPSGLALVPCALNMVDLSGQLRYSITHIPGKEECFVFLFLAPYARTTRYEEAFFSLENQGIFFPWKTKEFFSLGKPRKKQLASLARLMIINEI